ncbi:MAG: S8 family serine peptidase [bacterium]
MKTKKENIEKAFRLLFVFIGILSIFSGMAVLLFKVMDVVSPNESEKSPIYYADSVKSERIDVDKDFHEAQASLKESLHRTDDINESDMHSHHKEDPITEQYATRAVDENLVVNYSKKHILIQFSSEVEHEIEQGNKPTLPDKMKPIVSKGKVWKVEVGEDESVEELLVKYTTKHSHLVQYAQLDYECRAQYQYDFGIYDLGIYDFGINNSPGDKKLSKIDQDGASDPSQQYISSDETPLQNIQLLWYLDDINIHQAWNNTRGDSSVVIAILDTGIAYEDANFTTNERLIVSNESTKYKKAPGLGTANFWANSSEIPDNTIDDDGNGYVDDVNGFDFVNNDAHPNDDSGHGTFLANLIAHDTQEDRVGIATGCTIMPVKVLDYNGRGYASILAEGIYYAVDHGADVINLSLAWPVGIDPGPVVYDAISYAAHAGVIIVAGSGNDSKNAICYPAAYEQVIAVGATQLDKTRAYYSNYGTYMEVMAPGGNLYEDENIDGYPDGILQETFWPRYRFTLSEEILANPSVFGYTFTQGTSMSTAMVSGVIGLMLSIDPNMSLLDVRNVLHETAEDIEKNDSWDKDSGYGLINAGAALDVCIRGDYNFEDSNAQALVLDPIGDQSIDEGQILSFTISAGDPDTTSENLALSASNLPTGAVFEAATGLFTWIPDYTQAGTYDNVYFEVTDGDLIDSEEITITVTDINRPPVLNYIGDKSIDEGHTLSFTASASDPDTDDTLALNASNLPSGATFDAATGLFTWTPDYTQAGTYYNVCFEVTDGDLIDSEEITITVTDINQGSKKFGANPPILYPIGDKTICEGTTLNFTVSAIDPDTGDGLTLSSSNLPTGAMFYTATGVFTWTPDDTQASKYTGIHFEVTDGRLIDTEDITIIVYEETECDSCLDDEESPEIECDSCLDDEESPETECDSCLSDEKSPELEYDSCLDDEESPETECDSCLDDEKSSELEYDSCLDDEESPETECDTCLSDEETEEECG